MTCMGRPGARSDVRASRSTASNRPSTRWLLLRGSGRGAALALLADGTGDAFQVARPPRAGACACLRVREAVAIDREAKESRWRAAERVAREQRRDRRGVVPHAVEQRQEPAREAAPEQQEPDLEVDARLVRGDERGRAVDVAGLVVELVR